MLSSVVPYPRTLVRYSSQSIAVILARSPCFGLRVKGSKSNSSTRDVKGAGIYNFHALMRVGLRGRGTSGLLIRAD